MPSKVDHSDKIHKKKKSLEGYLEKNVKRTERDSADRNQINTSENPYDSLSCPLVSNN